MTAAAAAAGRARLGTHQRLDERAQHAAQQIMFGTLEVFGHERGKVNRSGLAVVAVISFSRAFRRSSEDHAVAVFYAHTTRRSSRMPYTTSMDSTK